MRLTVKNVDEGVIIRLAREYVSASYVTISSLATKYGTTPTTFSNILFRGIAEDIIDDHTAKLIYNKIVDKPSIGWYQRKLRWDEAFAKREALRAPSQVTLEQEEKLVELQAKKEYYESIIASYNDFFFDEDGAPTLESYQQKLDEVNRQIKACS